jgi:hypothetical protein
MVLTLERLAYKYLADHDSSEIVIVACMSHNIEMLEKGENIISEPRYIYISDAGRYQNAQYSDIAAEIRRQASVANV